MLVLTLLGTESLSRVGPPGPASSACRIYFKHANRGWAVLWQAAAGAVLEAVKEHRITA